MRAVPLSANGGDLPVLEGDFDLPAERRSDDPADGAAVVTESIMPQEVDVASAAVPLGRRIAAAVIDTLLLGGLFVLFLGAGEFALGGGRPLTESLIDLAIPYFLVLFSLCFGYFTLFHFFVGQTVGKMCLRLRVTGLDGEPLLFSQAFLRSTGGLLSILPAGVGFWLVFIDGSRRGWNDRLAGSRVVGCVGRAETTEKIAEEFSGAGN